MLISLDSYGRRNIWDGKLTRLLLCHQDNAPAHKSKIVMAAIQDCRSEHIPYLPDSFGTLRQLSSPRWSGRSGISILTVLKRGSLGWRLAEACTEAVPPPYILKVTWSWTNWLIQLLSGGESEIRRKEKKLMMYSGIQTGLISLQHFFSGRLSLY